MSTSSYTIVVRNMSATAQYFYLFQQQAAFDPAVSDSSILSGSLGCQAVGNYDATGASINFEMGTQIYAGAISTAPAVPPPRSARTRTLERVASTNVVRAIELASESTTALDCTTLNISPLGMSAPVNQSGIPPGAFGVIVPPYTPTPDPQIYCGLATINGDGAILLSSYIAPLPNATMSCTPEPIFYVKTGYKADGDVVAYDTTGAGQCDFTTGYTRITVTYNVNGTFSTKNGA